MEIDFAEKYEIPKCLKSKIHVIANGFPKNNYKTLYSIYLWNDLGNFSLKELLTERIRIEASVSRSRRSVTLQQILENTG